MIAIIAILAAILFPVFAQAKEAAKKTAALSNVKQTGTSVAIYLSDSDDTFPLQTSYNSATGEWRVGTNGGGSIYSSVPAGNATSSSRNTEPRKTQEGSFVLNALQPYMKSVNLFEAPGKNLITVSSTIISKEAAARINLSYNGILHSYSATAVAQPSTLPMFWQGFGRQNLQGLSFTTPMLDCSAANAPCMFNPGGMPDGRPGGAGTYGYTPWVNTLDPTQINVGVYGKSTVYVAADTSAKVRNWSGLPRWPQHAALNVNTNPFSSANATGGDDGSWYWMTDCVAPAARRTPRSIPDSSGQTASTTTRRLSVTMAAARLLVLIPFLAIIVGCGSSEPEAAPVGEVMTSKAGEAQMKASGGKPVPAKVPSVDD